MLNYNEYKTMVEENLLSFIPEVNPYAKTVKEAMEYSLKVGGKRLRPVLLLAATDFAGGCVKEALPFACALEYIHTYSLIHDDLPAMDNDDLRRGHPTNHKVYGEGMAVLAGDGLLNTAHEVIIGEILKASDDHARMTRRAKAAYAISNAAGINGMIGGQTADVENETKQATAELVKYIEDNKTGALLLAPVLAGMALSGADDKMTDNFVRFAKSIGQAFQISDDILDVEGDEALIGKKIGKDLDAGKCNYACVHGLDSAKAKLDELTQTSKKALSEYGNDADFFIELADKLKVRKA